MKTIWNAGILFTGVALFAFAVERVGASGLMRALTAMSGGLVIILALSLVRLFLQTRAWSIALQQDGIHSSASELMFLRLASQGIGYLTILGPAASEPMKIKLLRNHDRSATAATLIDSGVYWLSVGLVLVAGCISAGMSFGRHRIATLLAGLLAASAIFVFARRKVLLDLLGPRISNDSPRWLSKAARIESEIRRFARTYPSAIRSMFLHDLACQALLLAEVAVSLYLLHLPVRLGAVLSIEAAGRVVRLLAGWMPARIGADEGGAAAAFAALGFPAASGLALALARRIRDLLCSLAGLAWLACRTRADQNFAARQAEPAAVLKGALQCKV